MDARDTISQALKTDFGPFGPRAPEIYADALIKALTAAGFDIIHHDENHGPTRDRAAELSEFYAEAFIEGMVRYGSADRDAGRGRQEGHIDASHEIASSIRAMEVKP